jgi:hypothetical protein
MGAKKNKDRSRRQEQRVAKLFGGNRVPMSGAGSIKGDVMIPYDEYRNIYVECKLTEKDTMRIPVSWLQKIEEEAKAMRCIFGILVISFLHGKDYVLIRDLDLRQFYVEYPRYAHVIAASGKSFCIERENRHSSLVSVEDVDYFLIDLPVWKEYQKSKA